MCIIVAHNLTLMLLVATLAYTKYLKKNMKPWHLSTYLIVLRESFPMNTDMTGFRWFSILFALLCALDESSLSIGRVKSYL